MGEYSYSYYGTQRMLTKNAQVECNGELIKGRVSMGWGAAHSVVVEGLLGADVGVVPEAETDEAEKLYVVRLVPVHQGGGRAQVGDTIRLSHCNCLLVRLVVLRALVPLARRGTHELEYVRRYKFICTMYAPKAVADSPRSLDTRQQASD